MSDLKIKKHKIGSTDVDILPFQFPEEATDEYEGMRNHRPISTMQPKQKKFMNKLYRDTKSPPKPVNNREYQAR
jgi:hypothetical protein